MSATAQHGSTEREFRVVVVNAGTSTPSSTAMLAGRILTELNDIAASEDAILNSVTIELRDLAQEITNALVSGLQGAQLTRASELLAQADAVIAATPVYNAESSGLFSSFFQTLDRDVLVGTPVVLAATAGTSRHALVVDGQLRSQFAYLRALVTPTALFAATEDWNDPAFSKRIRRAAGELWLLLESRFAQRIRAGNWGAYQHDFGSVKESHGEGINLDTDLMRLATGGSYRG